MLLKKKPFLKLSKPAFHRTEVLKKNSFTKEDSASIRTGRYYVIAIRLSEIKSSIVVIAGADSVVHVAEVSVLQVSG